MKVRELIEALKRIPGDYGVDIVGGGDSWEATCVTTGGKLYRCVYICASNLEISSGERVLHDDEEEVS